MTRIQDWAILKKALINGESYNAEVEAYFKDGNAEVKKLCQVQVTDTMDVALQRQMFFYYQVLKVHHKPVIIGQPKSDFDADIKYHPEVHIYFTQDAKSVPKGSYQKTARISYRLMDKTSENITIADVNNAATTVFNTFFSTQYKFTKGKIIGWYIKPVDGLNLQVYCSTDDEALRVCTSVVTGIGKEFEDTYFKTTTPKRSNAATSETITILGKDKKKPQWRPTNDVYATGADLILWGNNNKEYKLIGKLGNGSFFAINRTS